MGVADAAESLFRRARFSDHLNAVLGAENVHDSSSNQLVVIDDEDADAHPIMVCLLTPKVDSVLGSLVLFRRDFGPDSEGPLTTPVSLTKIAL